MQYQIRRRNEVIEEGHVLKSVRMMAFLQSLSSKLEEGDTFQSKGLTAMYTGYGTWASVTSDMVKFQEMGLSSKTISKLRRRGETMSSIISSTERDFIKSYGRRIAGEIREGFCLTGKAFADGPPIAPTR